MSSSAEIIYHFYYKAMKIIDWQFLSCSPPIVDFCSLTLQNCHPNIVIPNLERFYHVYYQTFCQSCQAVGIAKPPFLLQDFIHQIETVGFAMTFISIMFMFHHYAERDPIVHDLRMQWLIKKCLRHLPTFFQ